MPVSSSLHEPKFYLYKITVTGANQGIGLGLAEVCFANSAARVYSLDISSPGEDFAALAKKNPDKFRYIYVDVTNEESVTKAIQEIVDDSGRLDGMIANAGMTKHQPALDFSMEQVEKLFKLNVLNLFLLSKKISS